MPAAKQRRMDVTAHKNAAGGGFVSLLGARRVCVRWLKKAAAIRLAAPDERFSEAGFTLLEVMIAFVIAALASIVLYQAGFSGAVENATSSHYQEAVIRAQSRLASIGVLTKLQPLVASGDDGGGFHWQLNIAPKAANGSVTLYVVQVTERFGNRDVTLDTERLGPKS